MTAPMIGVLLMVMAVTPVQAAQALFTQVGSIAHKATGGTAVAFPDVCDTPFPRDASLGAVDYPDFATTQSDFGDGTKQTKAGGQLNVTREVISTIEGETEIFAVRLYDQDGRGVAIREPVLIELDDGTFCAVCAGNGRIAALLRLQGTPPPAGASDARSVAVLSSGIDYPSYEESTDGSTRVFVRLRVTDGDLQAVRDRGSYQIEIDGEDASFTIAGVEPKTERQWDVVVAIGPRYVANAEYRAHVRALLPDYLGALQDAGVDARFVVFSTYRNKPWALERHPRSYIDSYRNIDVPGAFTFTRDPTEILRLLDDMDRFVDDPELDELGRDRPIEVATRAAALPWRRGAYRLLVYFGASRPALVGETWQGVPASLLYRVLPDVDVVAPWPVTASVPHPDPEIGRVEVAARLGLAGSDRFRGWLDPMPGLGVLPAPDSRPVRQYDVTLSAVIGPRAQGPDATLPSRIAYRGDNPVDVALQIAGFDLRADLDEARATGRVLMAQIVDEQNRPVENAEVTIWKWNGARMGFVGWVETDDSGTIELPALDRFGPYLIEVTTNDTPEMSVIGPHVVGRSSAFHLVRPGDQPADVVRIVLGPEHLEANVTIAEGFAEYVAGVELVSTRSPGWVAAVRDKLGPGRIDSVADLERLGRLSAALGMFDRAAAEALSDSMANADAMTELAVAMQRLHGLHSDIGAPIRQALLALPVEMVKLNPAYLAQLLLVEAAEKAADAFVDQGIAAVRRVIEEQLAGTPGAEQPLQLLEAASRQRAQTADGAARAVLDLMSGMGVRYATTDPTGDLSVMEMLIASHTDGPVARTLSTASSDLLGAVEAEPDVMRQALVRISTQLGRDPDALDALRILETVSSDRGQAQVHFRTLARLAEAKGAEPLVHTVLVSHGLSVALMSQWLDTNAYLELDDRVDGIVARLRGLAPLSDNQFDETYGVSEHAFEIYSEQRAHDDELADWRVERSAEDSDSWLELAGEAVAEAVGTSYELSDEVLDVLIPDVARVIDLIVTMTRIVETIHVVDRATDIRDTLDRVNTPAPYFEGVVTEVSDIGDRTGEAATQRLSSRPNVDLGALDEAFGLLGQ